jgi:hypothetical protein
MSKRIMPSPVRVPGRAAKHSCRARNTELTEHHGLKCNRRHGHGGRHAYILWGLNGLVRAVWADSAVSQSEAARSPVAIQAVMLWSEIR